MTDENIEIEEIEAEFEDWNQGPFSSTFKKNPHMVARKKRYYEDDLDRIDGVPYAVFTNLKPGEWVHDFQNDDTFPLDEIRVDSGSCSGGAIAIKNGRLEP